MCKGVINKNELETLKKKSESNYGIHKYRHVWKNRNPVIYNI